MKIDALAPSLADNNSESDRRLVTTLLSLMDDADGVTGKGLGGLDDMDDKEIDALYADYDQDIYGGGNDRNDNGHKYEEDEEKDRGDEERKERRGRERKIREKQQGRQRRRLRREQRRRARVEAAEAAKAPRLIVLAATNRPHALEPSLRRPGRFDREVIKSIYQLSTHYFHRFEISHRILNPPARLLFLPYFWEWLLLQIEVGVPTEAGRREIMRVLLRRLPCSYQRLTDDEAEGDTSQKEVIGCGEMREQPKGGIEDEAKGRGGGGSGVSGSSSKMDVVNDEDLAYLAANSHGFVGADLQLVCGEAVMIAVSLSLYPSTYLQMPCESIVHISS